MATVIDSLVISLGLDPTPVKSGLNQLAGLAAKFAGPIAGALIRGTDRRSVFNQ